MSTLIHTGVVAPADRVDYIQEITATTWVPMECRTDYRSDYRAEIRASGLGPMQVAVLDIEPITVRRTSNFLGTRPPLGAVRGLADESGYQQPTGERRSYLLVDGAQLVPGSFVDVQALDVDYLAFSFHKLLAPFGVGVLYGKEHLLASSLPFLYGGDMIAEGRVSPDSVEYNSLPWKYAAGTPNILGTIVSAQALRILVDLALAPDRMTYFGTARPLEGGTVRAAMDRIRRWNTQLVARALEGLAGIPGVTIYGPRDPARRTSLVAFTLANRDPFAVAEALDRVGVESRAGCHCATLAHGALALSPRATCRLSFYLYNTRDEVDRAVEAVAVIAAGRPAPRPELGRQRRLDQPTTARGSLGEQLTTEVLHTFAQADQPTTRAG
jgi:cysteine desulfurase/selenocysteine lyase